MCAFELNKKTKSTVCFIIGRIAQRENTSFGFVFPEAVAPLVFKGVIAIIIAIDTITPDGIPIAGGSGVWFP